MRSLFLLCLIFFSVGIADLQCEEAPSEKTLLQQFNEQAFSVILMDVSFGVFEVPAYDEDGQALMNENGQAKMVKKELPFIIAVLAFGAFFFSFFYRFINFRLFKHAIDVVRGKFDNPDDHGEITHFRALTSALSATIGLGNIAGVALAIKAGGPGAVFWMVAMAFFGMCSKFSSCTLSQLYRQRNSDNTISGGPMYYLDLGLKDMNLGFLGKILGVMYALMVMGGAMGGGNMFQVNQTAEAFRTTFQLSDDWNLWIGMIMFVMVAIVIVGGVRRIGAATSRIIPLMCGLYVLASLVIIGVNYEQIPETFRLIFNMAFTQNAVYGGMVGVIVTGVTRAAFSNEAGLGSAAIVHAAAKTDEPVREGIVAMLGPFIDTVIICTMTALVVIVSGVWNDHSITSSGNLGVALTTQAFATAMDWFPYVLTVSIALFAYSTMISWCYYGERGWIYLLDHLKDGLGIKSVIVFRLIFLFFIILGATQPLADVLDFSDVMILSMAFPNILGSIILAPRVWVHVKNYWDRYRRNELKTYS